MLGLIALGVLGWIGASLAFDWWDDDDDAAAPAPPGEGDITGDLLQDILNDENANEGENNEGDSVNQGDDVDEPEDSGPALTQVGDTITATQGDDVLDDDDIESLENYRAANTLNLLGGDDVYSHEGALNYSNTINGGSGNDVISSNVGEWEDTLNGGAGNDTLSADIGTSAFGGVGDDVINYNHGSGLGDFSVAQLDGGDGDDSITVTEAIGFSQYYDHSGAVVRGGDGADTITFELIDIVPETSPGESPEFDEEEITGFEGQDDSLVRVEGFDPEEDTLVVDISSFVDNGNLDFTEAQLTEGEAGQYELELSFTADGATDPFTTTINIQSDSRLMLDDIDIISKDGSGTTYYVAGGFAGTDGDDNVISYAESSYAEEFSGGPGNDSFMLTELWGSVVNGGEGNDTINLEQRSYDEELTVLRGDGGDDTFNLDLTIAQETLAPGSPPGSGATNFVGEFGIIASGGDGADIYNIELNTERPGVPPSQTGPLNEAAELLTITDFDPAEDTVVLDLSDTGTEYQLTSVETRLSGGGTSTEIVITLTNTAGQNSVTIIDLGSMTGDPDLDAQDFLTIIGPTG